MTAVLKHELRLYFHSLTAYVFGAFLLAFIGIGSMLYNLQAAVSNFEYVLSFGCLVFDSDHAGHCGGAEAEDRPAFIVPSHYRRTGHYGKVFGTSDCLFYSPVYHLPVSADIFTVRRCISFDLLWIDCSFFSYGSGIAGPWAVYLIFNRQPGLCGRNRDCRYTAELLQCQSFRVHFLYGIWIRRCHLRHDFCSGMGDPPFDKKRGIGLWNGACAACRYNCGFLYGCNKIRRPVAENRHKAFPVRAVLQLCKRSL